VLILGVLLLSLASIIVQRTTTEARQSISAAEYGAALHAAEAGVNDYIAKVTEDHLYYGHEVHPAEDRRTRTAGGTIASGQPWPGDPTWTYATADRYQSWRPVGAADSQYEYNLVVSPPGGGTVAITVTATGRKRSDPRVRRSIEVQFQGTSVADFQMLSAASVSYGSAATTNGKVYSKINVNHDGLATKGVYAEGNITGSGTFQDDKCNGSGSTGCKFSDVMKPIDFNTFSGSLTEVRRASQSSGGGGIYLDLAGISSYRITFHAAGTLTVEKCTSGTGDDAAPSGCSNHLTNVAVPSIGAIYATKNVLVKGTLKGRVTIVSTDNIVIIDNIAYANGMQDVLGLIADENIYVADYTPNTLTWYGAVIARSGRYAQYDCSTGKSGTYTHVGAVATANGGCMSGYATRVYNYDVNLQFLQPPFFPVLEEAYKILRYREID
jgi:hypothetical protein